MFVNFKNEINSKQSKLPQQLVESLSENLPNGLMYTQDDKGVCTVVSDDKSLEISDLEIVITDKMKKVLGDSFTTEELYRYLYNSQTTVEIRSRKPGYLIVNGEKVKNEDFIYDPFSRLNYNNRKLYLNPQKMNERIKFDIGTKDYSKEVEFERQPDESINNIKLKSINNNHLNIEVYYNDIDKKIDLKISYELKGIKRIEDVVETLEIYYAFVDGEGYINGERLRGTNKNTDNSINKDNLMFWRRFLSVEQKTNKTFDLSKNGYNISPEEESAIDDLYINLLKKVPIRINNRFNSIDGYFNKEKDDLENFPTNGNIMFKFRVKTTYHIKGRRITLPSIVMVFNVKCVDVKCNGDKYKLLLDDYSEKEKMYYSMMSFVDEEDMEKYLSDENGSVSKFKNAKLKKELLLKQ